MLTESRGDGPLGTLDQSVRRATRPLHTVVAASHGDPVGSFRHVVFAINHYLPDVGRELVYAYALRRANLEGFCTLTFPVFYDREYGAKPRDFAMALRIALIGQDNTFGNQVTSVNLVAGDAQSMAAPTSLFPRDYL